MRTFQFHMPHVQPPKWRARNGVDHHQEPMSRRSRRFEGALDYVVSGGVLMLVAAMLYGLLSATGDAPAF